MSRRTDSLWLTEDHENFIFETNPHTGALKRVINNAAFQNAPQFGGGPVAGPNRTDDFESMAYDEANDWLFVFSGPCCDASHLPTVFRLVRVGGVFQVESYQPLAATANNTASAWSPADQKLYVGQGQQIRTYDYVTNTTGTAFTVTGLNGILGFSFSSVTDTGGSDLFVVTNAERLRRVDWATKTLVPGWTFELTPFDVLDSRGGGADRRSVLRAGWRRRSPARPAPVRSVRLRCDRAPARGSGGVLHRRADERQRSSQRGLRRHVDEQPDQLGVGLRDRRHRRLNGAEPDARVPDACHLHGRP